MSCQSSIFLASSWKSSMQQLFQVSMVNTYSTYWSQMLIVLLDDLFGCSEPPQASWRICRIGRRRQKGWGICHNIPPFRPHFTLLLRTILLPLLHFHVSCESSVICSRYRLQPFLLRCQTCSLVKVQSLLIMENLEVGAFFCLINLDCLTIPFRAMVIFRCLKIGI